MNRFSELCSAFRERSCRNCVFVWLVCVLSAASWGARAATIPGPPRVVPPREKLPSPQPPPPLAIKTAPPQQVIVPGLQPGKIIEMALSGGRPPIQIAIDAGPNSQLFSVAQRPANTGRNLRERDRLFSPGSPNSLSSADELLGIRYAGVTSTAQLASQIPVTVRATDSAGATVTAAVMVYPVVPELTLDTFSFSNVIARQPITVGVSVAHLPPGVGVFPTGNRLFESLTVAETNCFFLTNNVGPGANADLNGRARFRIEGTFGVRSAAAAPSGCTFAMEFGVGGFGVGSHTFLLKKGSISLVAPVTYTVENTSVLKSLFNFSPSTLSQNTLGGTFGTCSGTSYGSQEVTVGIVEVDKDLAFRIRSGPIGTGCEWHSQRVDVQSGLRLVAMNWEVNKVGTKCCSGTLKNCEPNDQYIGGMPTEALPIVSSPSFDFPPFYDGGGARIAEGINGSPQGNVNDWGKTYFTPMTVRLRCDPTLVNDHGITLRLKSVVLEGPPGSKFP